MESSAAEFPPGSFLTIITPAEVMDQGIPQLVAASAALSPGVDMAPAMVELPVVSSVASTTTTFSADLVSRALASSSPSSRVKVTTSGTLETFSPLPTSGLREASTADLQELQLLICQSPLLLSC